MSEHQDEPGHGNSVAAWTAVIVAIIGVTAVTLGVLINMMTLTWIGTALTVISIPLGPIMAKLGYGVAGKSSK